MVKEEYNGIEWEDENRGSGKGKKLHWKQPNFSFLLFLPLPFLFVLIKLFSSHAKCNLKLANKKREKTQLWLHLKLDESKFQLIFDAKTNKHTDKQTNKRTNGQQQSNSLGSLFSPLFLDASNCHHHQQATRTDVSKNCAF